MNYVEGQAKIAAEPLNAKSVGSVTLEGGQTLTTGNGKAEVLLTPGVFLRSGENSAATMVSPSLTNTEVALANGQAMVEVSEIHKDNLLRVQEHGATTQLMKTGLYGFDANSGDVRVFKGEALVQDGERQIKVKGGHELDLASNGELKARSFDKSSYERSDLYRFSNLRSEYLAEANVDAASVYVAGGPGWFGPGWYWDPFFTAYTWIPGGGMLYSPFGWGFYSPAFVGYAPYYGRYGRGYPYGYSGRVTGNARPYTASPRIGYAGRPATGFSAGNGGGHFGVMGGGFHGGSGGFRGR